jgi:hypothetical protein
MPREVVKRPATDRRSRLSAALRRGPHPVDIVTMCVLILGGVVTGATLPNPAGELLPIGAVAAYFAGRTLLRLGLGSDAAAERVVTDEAGLADLAAARDAADRVIETWPAVGPVVGGASAAPTLHWELWELAGELRRRAEITEAGQQVEALLADLPADDVSVAGLTGRLDELATRFDSLNASIAARIARLQRLATACRQHLAAQATRQRVEQVARRADAVLHDVAGTELGLPGRDDAAADLAERTEAVLAAYRELTGRAA